MKGVVYNMNGLSWIRKYQKILHDTKIDALKQTKIMQIRSRDLTAPHSFKISLRKNGHTF